MFYKKCLPFLAECRILNWDIHWIYIGYTFSDFYGGFYTLHFLGCTMNSSNVLFYIEELSASIFRVTEFGLDGWMDGRLGGWVNG